jgi:hypothetical protein
MTLANNGITGKVTVSYQRPQRGDKSERREISGREGGAKVRPLSPALCSDPSHGCFTVSLLLNNNSTLLISFTRPESPS